MSDLKLYDRVQSIGDFSNGCKGTVVGFSTTTHAGVLVLRDQSKKPLMFLRGELKQIYEPVAPKKRIYIIGSLRNQFIGEIAQEIRGYGYEVFDDWYAAGPEADDYWKKYEQARGRSYTEALQGHAAKNVFAFDKRNLDASDAAILVLPAGKSGHLELGYMAGKDKPTFVLLDEEQDRWDVMYQFATGVCYRKDLKETLHGRV